LADRCYYKPCCWTCTRLELVIFDWVQNVTGNKNVTNHTKQGDLIHWHLPVIWMYQDLGSLKIKCPLHFASNFKLVKYLGWPNPEGLNARFFLPYLQYPPTSPTSFRDSNFDQFHFWLSFFSKEPFLDYVKLSLKPSFTHTHPTIH
jgi:hypothetical protein